MSLVRLVIVTLLLVPVNSLTCYDCTAPDDYFCYPFIKCEVKKTECIYDDIYNPEAFITDPPVEFSCLKLDYDKSYPSKDDAVKKCIGKKPGYNFCEDSPMKPPHMKKLPKCHICGTDLCNISTKPKIYPTAIIITTISIFSL